MADFARGPVDFGPMPLRPPVMQPDTFQSLGRALLDAHRGFDAVLGERMRQIASASATNLDADYNDSVGPALNDLGALDRTIDFDKPLEIVANCDAAEARLLAILGDLPDPNATDPSIDPPPPDADPGAGRDLHATPAPPVVGRPAPAPPSDLIGPDALHATSWSNGSPPSPGTRRPTRSCRRSRTTSAMFRGRSSVRRPWSPT
jgi:hypothetical protein